MRRFLVGAGWYGTGDGGVSESNESSFHWNPMVPRFVRYIFRVHSTLAFPPMAAYRTISEGTRNDPLDQRSGHVYWSLGLHIDGTLTRYQLLRRLQSARGIEKTSARNFYAGKQVGAADKPVIDSRLSGELTII